MFDRRFVVFGLAGSGLAACAPGGDRVEVPPGTTFILLRHAERAGEDLNDAGRARAAALVPALAGIEVDAIYSPGLQRNLDTAAPLAAARGLAVQRLPAENPARAILAQSAGKSVVWIGNKGNLNAIWDSLGAADPPPLNYGDLYIVTRGAFGAPRVERRRFGA